MRSNLTAPERACPQCLEYFSPKRPDSQFCSHTCRAIYFGRRRVKAAREVLQCIECGVPFIPNARPKKAKFCSRACASLWVARRRRQPPEVRFWSKVDKSGECWIWTAGRCKGYGSFR